ncbi:OLC1v1009198C2 [Oldenlandia corymbosa var. corymbosa]|uniref:OLC1v1009198C2 n=1 Tax=Oldenlandia corymbosa var. corymbosa TaxID=529605 RepID=A0AAV1DNY0_OLDCO|nr:OLC1v1009198C2 [Oldenlandia corymbosa var. corymbosa]
MEFRAGRRSRDNNNMLSTSSPERIKICTNQQQQNQQQTTKRSMMMRPVPSFKRVQVVYYLSRNGQLEHPHYIEVTHLASQQLRLKDVIDRLNVLRGKGMPSLYSWSCKKSYKNGYVWNDLSENDIIYPSEGAEYILKGSEVIVDGSTSGKFQQLPSMENFSFHPKQRPVSNHSYEEEHDDNETEELGVVDDEEYEEKIRYSDPASTTTRRCSKGVSTDEIHHQQEKQKNPRSHTTEINLENSSSPPSTTSSSLSDKGGNENNSSKRFEDGDPLISRNSMLFQILACGGGGVGGSLSFRGKHFSAGKQQHQQPPPPSPPPKAAGVVMVARRRRSSCSDLHKEVFCKSLMNNNNNNNSKKMNVEEDDDEIKCMSENPRFGNLQSEEKEYFSGSIVDSISNEERLHVVPSGLKKSSSYNEERGSKLAVGDAGVGADQEDVKKAKSCSHSKSKCIPKIMSPYSKQPSKK